MDSCYCSDLEKINESKWFVINYIMLYGLELSDIYKLQCIHQLYSLTYLTILVINSKYFDQIFCKSNDTDIATGYYFHIDQCQDT